MPPLLDKLYHTLYEEEDARVCLDISESACTEVPKNFFLNAGATSLGSLADAIANAKTTLPWLLSAVGAPAWIIAILVPIRESGSMLPQLAVGGWVRHLPRRKWVYVGGAVTQAVSLLVMALSVMLLTGLAAGLGVLVCMVTYSLARSACSLASKDVIGKTVPKTRRGRATGLSASIAGAGTLVLVALFASQPAAAATYVWLIIGAACCWLLAAAAHGLIEEEAGATEGGRNGLHAALARVSLLRDDQAFRNFVIGRALLMGTALAAPFVVLLARERSDAGLLEFLLAQGLASLLSGHIWGSVADRSSRKLLLTTALLAGLLGSSVFAVDRLYPHLTATSWFLPAVFFALAVIHDGVRMGRKTYLLDLGQGNRRTDYVAVSNTLMGILLLVAGGLASAVQNFGTVLTILLFSLTAYAAMIFLWRMPEAQS